MIYESRPLFVSAGTPRIRMAVFSFLFLLQVLLVGLGGDVVAEVADGELGITEEGSIIGGDEGAGHTEEVVVGGFGEALREFLGLFFLSGGEGFLHGRFSDVEGGLFSTTLLYGLVYKNSTNFRDAHTERSVQGFFS